MLTDEIFGEKNRLGILVWKQAVDNNPTRIATEHEYLLCYAKNEAAVPERWEGISPAKEWLLRTYEGIHAKESDPAVIEKLYRAAIREQKAKYKRAAEEGRTEDEIDLGRMERYRNVNEVGPWAKDWQLENPRPNGYDYDIIHPVTGKPCKKPPKGYRYSKESMDRLLANDLIVFGEDETEPAQLRRYLKQAGAALRSVIRMPGRLGPDTLKAIFPEGAERFPNPKPVELITLLIEAAADMDALVLDPFAGSGTTAHAVLRLNGEDGGVRRFVMIEEGTKEDRYCRTLTAPRVKEALKKEKLPGGFAFESLGKRLDREAILELQREAISNLIIQTDATGRGRGITKIRGKLVVGSNPRGEAICLCWNGRAKSKVTSEILAAMYDEAKARGLKRPLRVYGSTCDVGETDSFRFCQIPDEILAALQIDESDDAEAFPPPLEVAANGASGSG
jgi:adenine-specific DNA-methyltransferase